MEKSIFKELGFSEREIKVYIALLELGLTKVGSLASRSRLQHSKVYQTLDKLIEKGLVSYIIISKTKHFQASDPKEILNLIEDKKRRFLGVLDELEKKQKYSQSKQIAIIHEGLKSFKSLFSRLSDELRSGESYWAFAFKEEYNTPKISLFLKKFHKALEEKKIDDRILGNTSVKGSISKTFQENKNIKIRFTKNELPIGVIISKNKVINLVWGERPTAIEISSEQIYNQYIKFFLGLWGKAKQSTNTY